MSPEYSSWGRRIQDSPHSGVWTVTDARATRGYPPAVAAPKPRLSEPAESRDLRDLLVAAFADDPVVSWVFEDPESRPGHSAAFFDSLLRRLGGHDLVWTTDDLAGAACWARPGHWRESPMEVLRMARHTLFGMRRNLLQKMRGLAGIEARHPSEPHLYLATVGVRPGRQGEGIGSALIRPGLQYCDAAGLPAYLESSNERNVPLYERHGFEVTEELVLPGGPTVWLMWREARVSESAARGTRSAEPERR